MTGSSTALVTLMLPNKFVARASVIADAPQNPGLSGTIAQFAGQFGLNALSSASVPEFYRTLMTSRGVLTKLASTQFIVRSEQPSTFLYRYYYPAADSLTAPRAEQMVRRLQRDIGTTVDARTGVIRVEVAATDSHLASEMLDSLIAITNRFAVSNLRGRAKAKRIFVEGQVEAASQNLVLAEDSLRTFYERNRRIADSPQLQFEEARLRRRVDLRQEIAVTLSRELEQARIDEVRDTRLANVIDPPLPPTRQQTPRRAALTILRALLGAI